MPHKLATNALGSAAGHLYRAGEQKRALEVSSQLVQELGQQEEPDEQQVYLLALGNAGLQQHEDTVCAYASSPSSTVRYQVASSLRKLGGEGSRTALLDLATDSVERVQKRALSSLHEREDLTSNDIEHLAQLVESHRIVESAYPDLITLLAPRLRQDPVVRAIFETMLAQELQDNDIKARIRALLSN
jgi:HEAT repeat protein